MEMNFSELRAKEVINTQDGRKLGRVCDLVLCYPENRWLGIVVPGARGFGRKNELFIELKNVVKIGEDVILVNVGFPQRQGCGKRVHGMPVSCADSTMGGTNGVPRNRNYEEFE